MFDRKKYNSSPERKQKRKEYDNLPHVKEKRRLYNTSERRKAYMREYKKTRKFRESVKRYRLTPKGKQSTRNKYLKNCYGISLEEYNKIYVTQDGKCAICVMPSSKSKKDNLAVDHNHETGKVRGLLCIQCNSAIGLLGESIKILEQAMEYLKERQ